MQFVPKELLRVQQPSYFMKIWNWFSKMWNWISLVWNWISLVWNWISLVWNWISLVWNWFSFVWNWISFVWNWISFVRNRPENGIVLQTVFNILAHIVRERTNECTPLNAHWLSQSQSAAWFRQVWMLEVFLSPVQAVAATSDASQWLQMQWMFVASF